MSIEILKPMIPALSQQTRSNERVKIMLESAYTLLIENGLLEFSTTKVAKHAGLGRPSLFRYWSSNLDMVECVVACIVASGKELTDREQLLVDSYNLYYLDSRQSQFKRYTDLYQDQKETD